MTESPIRRLALFASAFALILSACAPGKSQSAWDRWGITLPIVTDWMDQVDSVNTLFACDAATEATMTWMVTAYDMDGYFADCAVWGKRIEYYASHGCWEVAF